jgi:hypothetical protein
MDASVGRSTLRTSWLLALPLLSSNTSGSPRPLKLTLLILAQEPVRFRAAALRWHARYCGDNKASLEEATAVLGLLAMLDGRRAKTAAQALAGLLDSRRLLPGGRGSHANSTVSPSIRQN